MSTTPDLKELPKPLRKLLKALMETEGASIRVVKLGPCGDPDCKDCAQTGTIIGHADAAQAQQASQRATNQVGEAAGPGPSARDSADAFGYAAAAFSEQAQKEEASTLAKLGEISVQARAQVTGDLKNFIRNQIRVIQATLIDIEFDGREQPDGAVEHLQARINHLRNFKALFEAKA